MRRIQRSAKEHGARHPDRALAFGDGRFERLGVRIDLVGADHLLLAGEERSVDLDDVALDAGGLDRILLVAEGAELGARLLGLEYLGELPADGEALAEPLGRDVRPLERPVGVPDLHAQDVRALGEVAIHDRGRAVADLERGAVDHARAEDAVGVLGQAELRVVESLFPHGARQQRAQDQAAACQHDRAEQTNVHSNPTDAVTL